MNFKLLTLNLLVIIISSEGQGQYAGDRCRMGYGRRRHIGRCVLLSRCDYALEQLRNNYRPQICGFQSIEPIVCCPRQYLENVHQTPAPEPVIGLKSQQKCKEYIDAKIDDKLQLFTAVVGGVQASAKEFPHMAALGFGEDFNVEWQCGGTLISELFVLTAAHCLVSQELGDVKFVRLGDLDLKDIKDDAQPQNFKVVQVFRHPDYKPPEQYNDIALIKLDHPAVFSSYVKPACLQTEFELPSSSAPIATGWGRLGYTADSSPTLMKVNLSYFDNEQCRKVYANIPQRRLPRGIDNNLQICAGGLNESKDTCQGDSGGPLQIPHPDKNAKKMYIVLGVTSFGKGCGIENIPGVYTRVSNYVSWIEQTAWPE